MTPPRFHSSWKAIGVGLLVLTLGGVVRASIGTELAVGVFFIAPAAIGGWFFGRWAALGIALVSILVWVAVDRVSGHAYSHSLYRYWNAAILFISSSVAGIVLARFRSSMDERDRAYRELTKALEQGQQSRSDIVNLQRKLHVICAWTKQIKEEGRWVPIEDYLSRHLGFNFTHGISPKAQERFDEELEEKKG